MQVWISSSPRICSSVDYILPIPFSDTASRVYRQHPHGDQSRSRLLVSPHLTYYGQLHRQQPHSCSSSSSFFSSSFHQRTNAPSPSPFCPSPSTGQWNLPPRSLFSPSPFGLCHVCPSLEFSQCFPSSKKSLVISSFHLFQFDGSLPRLPGGGGREEEDEEEEERLATATASSRPIPIERLKDGKSRISALKSSTRALPFQKIPIECFFGTPEAHVARLPLGSDASLQPRVWIVQEQRTPT